jgi:hypothetical protein
MKFVDDVAVVCRAKLLAAAYNLEASSTSEDDVLNYLRVARRRIEPRPRIIHVATELICPPELQSGFDAVKARAAAGLSLRPYQSKRVAQPSYEDGLLNAWDIHHFHLGASIDASGWASRTGPLLYARITETDFFCIKILDHGAWTQQDLIATIHRNWPGSLSRFRMKEGAGLQPALTDEQVKTLRDKNVNVAVQVEDGAVYMSPGLGSMSDGTGVWVGLARIKLLKICNELERLITEQMNDANSAVGAALAANNIAPDATDFHLTFDGENVVLVDGASGVAVNIGPWLAVPALN